MTDEPFYKAHWRDVEAERMAAYKDGFDWDDAAETLYAAADIMEGQLVADFGCGPGKVAVELAKRVGPSGHVHAIDINADFLGIAHENATREGVSDQLSTHQNDGVSLPFSDGALDRVTARNTIMYVDDPVATLREFYRVLRQDGLAHAIDGDWYMMVAEPVEHDLWRSFVKAAAHACRTADMGRRLHATFRSAGFQDVRVSVIANADTNGRLLGMVRNMAKYAAQSGMLGQTAIDEVVAQVEQALRDDRYLVVSPQFIVTGHKSN